MSYSVDNVMSYKGYAEIYAELAKKEPIDAKDERQFEVVDEHLYEMQNSALGLVWLTPLCFLAVPMALYASTDAGLFDGPAALFGAFDHSLFDSAVVSSVVSELARLSTHVDWNVMLAGFLAQLVDGSLGMGFGITSATVLTHGPTQCPHSPRSGPRCMRALLTLRGVTWRVHCAWRALLCVVQVLTSWAGVSPLMASSAVHLAQLGTTAVSGYAHHRQGNTGTWLVIELTTCACAHAAVLMRLC
jgi:hypothetical protein